VAQNLGQRIGKSSWLRELQNISLSHGVSLLCWRSGGVEHLHDTPPYPSRRHQLSPIAPPPHLKLYPFCPLKPASSRSGQPQRAVGERGTVPDNGESWHCSRRPGVLVGERRHRH